MLMGCLVCVCSAFALAQHESVAPSAPAGPPPILARRMMGPEPDPIVDQLERDAYRAESRASAIEQLADLAKDARRDVYTRVNAIRALARANAVEAQETLREMSRFPATRNTEEERVASQLAHVARMAYWEIELSSQSSDADRLDILLALSQDDRKFFETHELLRPSSMWLAKQLAAFGDPKLLPAIADVLGAIVDEEYRLVPNQKNTGAPSEYMEIKTLTLGLAAHMDTHGDRFEALKAFMEDPFGHEPEDDPRRHIGVNHHTDWAVQEIYKLGTKESTDFLVEYAKDLQERFHDERGEAIVPAPPGDSAAFMVYRRIVALLRDREGWTPQDFAKHELYPDRYFRFL